VEKIFQIFIAHGVNYVRQTEKHTAEPLVPEPSTFEVEMATEKLKRHKSPGIDQIPAEFVKEGGRTIGLEQFSLRSVILLILFRIRRNCLRIGRSRSFYVFIEE
jgi:hypothetical protein